jgi:hypothetical protein
MKPSQNSLFKADTCVRSVAKGRILGLVHGLFDEDVRVYLMSKIIHSLPEYEEAEWG